MCLLQNRLKTQVIEKNVTGLYDDFHWMLLSALLVQKEKHPCIGGLRRPCVSWVALAENWALLPVYQ